MKTSLLLLLFIVFFACGAKASSGHKDLSRAMASGDITDGFITTWVTDGANQQIVIPINGAYSTLYNYNVNWGDGSASNGLTANATHTYLAAGTHTVTITGAFPAIRMWSTANIANNNQRLTSVVQWGNGTWKGMENAFRYCQNLTTVPNLNGPVFEPNSTLIAMFYDCSKLNCDLNLWDLTNVVSLSYMFYGATAFNGNIGNWNVSNVTDMTHLFDKALVFNRDISSWNVSKVTSMSHMFENARLFNGNIGNWNVGSVTDMTYMFFFAFAFNQNIGNWNVGNVTNMSLMFSNVPVFNQDLNNWDVSKVQYMSYMFQGDGDFNGNIQSWNVSNVLDMTYMFNGAIAFNQDLSGWDVRKVNSMAGMFNSATSFNQDISGWQTNALTILDNFLDGAQRFNQNISGWDVSKVTSMQYAFYGANAFDQNLGNWQVSQVNNMNHMLDEAGMSAANYESTLTGWAAQSLKSDLILGAADLRYCSITAHEYLKTHYNWQILDDRRVCLVPAVPDGNGIVYVDSAVAVPGDGSSWSSALQFLSNATESAKTDVTIKEVHIAKGSYYPSGYKQYVFKDTSFFVQRAGLKLMGGYANGGGARNIEQYPTILSGDAGVHLDTSDNVNHVMVIENIANGTDSLIVDGFTITGGNEVFDLSSFSSFFSMRFAGGVCLISANANTVVKNCLFTGNYGDLGSAMSLINTGSGLIVAPQVINCDFKNNKVIGHIADQFGNFGSTLVCLGMSPELSHCDFTDNVGYLGGAASCLGGAPVFYDCQFLRNSAMGGAAVRSTENASPVFLNCAFLDNFNVGFDPGVLLPPELQRLYSNALLISTNQSVTNLTNVTIANNKSLVSPATGTSLIINTDGSTTNITNSIIWGNVTNTWLDTLGATLSNINYSLIQGQPADPASHLLDGTLAAPVFADTTAGNFQLIAYSAAIDNGLNDSLLQAMATYFPGFTAPGFDLAGNPRIKDGTIDLGAYERSDAPLPVHLKYFSGELAGGMAELHWESGLESGLNQYDIEKSGDGKSFKHIAFVQPTGSNSNYTYRTIQSEPAAYYRLKITQKGGKSPYSPTIRLAANAEAQALLLYPNPAKDFINVRTAAEGSLLIYSAAGQFIKAASLKTGINIINITELPAGAYFGVLGTRKLKFIKQ